MEVEVSTAKSVNKCCCLHRTVLFRGDRWRGYLENLRNTFVATGVKLVKSITQILLLTAHRVHCASLHGKGAGSAAVPAIP